MVLYLFTIRHMVTCPREITDRELFAVSTLKGKNLFFPESRFFSVKNSPIKTTETNTSVISLIS